MLCFWDSRYPSYLLLVGVSLDFCSLKAARISISQLPGQRNLSGLFRFGWVFFHVAFSCWQQRDSSPWQAESCSDSFPVLNYRVVYRKDRNGSCKDGYLLQLFFSTCDLFGFYIEKKTEADSIPCFKALFCHWAFPFSNECLWFSHCCSWAVEEWRAGGKVPWRPGRGCWELLTAGSRMGWGGHTVYGMIILSLAFFA